MRTRTQMSQCFSRWGKWQRRKEAQSGVHMQPKMKGGVHTVPGALAYLATLHLPWILPGNAWQVSQPCMVSARGRFGAPRYLKLMEMPCVSA